MENYYIDKRYSCYRELLSEYYDCLFPECTGKELDFWLEQLKGAEGQILEIGCGTGRITIPLLEKGYDVTVIDNSPFMLDKFKKKCADKSINVKVYELSMQNLVINQKFGLIFIGDCGLGLITKDDEIELVFNNIKNHLNPGGSFIFEIETTYSAKDLEKNNGKWFGSWTFGLEDILYDKRQLTQYDPETHIRESLLVLEKFKDGILVETEANLGRMRFYNSQEVIDLLKKTGYINITVTEWASDRIPGSDSKILSIKCNNPK